MSARPDLRVDPYRDRRAGAAGPGDLDQQVELGLGFHIDLADARAQGEFDLRLGLAGAGKDHLAGRDPGLQRPQDLALRDRVRPRAQARQGGQHRKVGVGLDRVGDLDLARREGVPEHLVVPGQGGAGIDVDGRAHLLGDAPQGNIFAVKLARASLEMIHRGMVEGCSGLGRPPGGGCGLGGWAAPGMVLPFKGGGGS